MAVNSADEDCQGDPDVSVTSDGGRNIQEWKSQTFSEAPSLNSLQKTSDAPLNCQYLGRVKFNDLDIHNLSNLDLDIEEGRLEIPIANDDTFGVSKSQGSWAGALRNKISLHGGGRFMHLLTNNSLELPKFMSRDKSMTERTFDTPTSRARKYKRSASFNSRRVVLLFSVLSSLGTVILILLTLRQVSDGYTADS